MDLAGGERGHQAGHPLASGGADPPGGRVPDASLLLRRGLPLPHGGARARPAHGGELAGNYGQPPWTCREELGLKTPTITSDPKKRMSSVLVVWAGLVGIPVTVLRRLRLQ